MPTIEEITAREILNSKGIPTVEVTLISDKATFVASCPSGTSTGDREALEVRDGDKDRYFGKGVLRAVQNVKEIIAPALIGKNPTKQTQLDNLLLELDGTENKQNLGANALLPVSMAICRAGAYANNLPLYEHLAHLSSTRTAVMPKPMVLMIEGGRHGDWATDIQEYMIIPNLETFGSFSKGLESAVEVYTILEEVLSKKGYGTGIGYEGAFRPSNLASNTEPFDLILLAIAKAGFDEQDFSFAIDVAGSEFFHKGKYTLKKEKKTYSPDKWQEVLLLYLEKYPLEIIEDPLDQNSWQDWSKFVERVGSKSVVVGDDLITTNPKSIQKAITAKAITGSLIKPNQIGTVSETLVAVSMSKKEGIKTIISHRSGETNDSFIADLAVGVGSEYCKFGAPARGEREAKYNRLLQIEPELLG